MGNQLKQKYLWSEHSELQWNYTSHTCFAVNRQDEEESANSITQIRAPLKHPVLFIHLMGEVASKSDP